MNANDAAGQRRASCPIWVTRSRPHHLGVTVWKWRGPCLPASGVTQPGSPAPGAVRTASLCHLRAGVLPRAALAGSPVPMRHFLLCFVCSLQPACLLACALSHRLASCPRTGRTQSPSQTPQETLCRTRATSARVTDSASSLFSPQISGPPPARILSLHRLWQLAAGVGLRQHSGAGWPAPRLFSPFQLPG